MKMIDDDVAELVGQRQEAKEKKEFGEADRIRDQLLEHGVILSDRPWGVRVFREWTTLTAAKPERNHWFDYDEAKRKAKEKDKVSDKIVIEGIFRKPIPAREYPSVSAARTQKTKSKEGK